MTQFIEQTQIAHPKIYVGNSEGSIAYPKSCMGNPKRGVAHPKSYIGNPEGDVAHSKSYMGNPEEGVAYPKSYVGNPEGGIAHPKSCMGNSEGSVAYPKSYMGNTEPLAALPEIFTWQSGIMQKLQYFLSRQKVAGSYGQAIVASAALIIHGYNKMPCDYQSLRKITALSQFGLTKRISAIKKDGFIVISVGGGVVVLGLQWQGDVFLYSLIQANIEN